MNQFALLQMLVPGEPSIGDLVRRGQNGDAALPVFQSPFSPGVKAQAVDHFAENIGDFIDGTQVVVVQVVQVFTAVGVGVHEHSVDPAAFDACIAVDNFLVGAAVEVPGGAAAIDLFEARVARPVTEGSVADAQGRLTSLRRTTGN